jgi:hypothetical protein
VGIIERALSRVDRPGFDPAAVEAGEELLTRFAHQFGPKDTEPPHSPGPELHLSHVEQLPPSQPDSRPGLGWQLQQVIITNLGGS